MATCEHCLLPLDANTAIREEVGGREAFFCCPGCRSIYALLHAQGLAEFYRRRTGWVPGPPELFAADPDALSDCVVEREGEHEATLAISGIRCASCVWVIERYLGRKPGVSLVRVNHATGRAKIRFRPGSAGIAEIASWIRELGYAPHPCETGELEESLRREKRDLLLRFGTAAFLSMQVMTFTTALYAGYFQGIEPKFLAWFQWLSFALTTPVIFYSGYPFLRNTLAGIRNRAPGMDTLVFLGSFSAYAYSAAMLVVGGEVYFDTAGMIITLILLGRYLEAAARSRAKESIGRLVRLAPREARRRMGSGFGGHAPRTETVPVSSLRANDIIEIVPGEKIPADGIVIEGASEADESTLTGEAGPVAKGEGSAVCTGTVNGSGRLVVRVTQTGKETVLSRIVRAVEEAQARKAPVQRHADRVVGWFVPAVIAVAALTLGARLQWGDPPLRAILVAISVLVVACPCALGLATPLAVFIGSNAARAQGILVRGGDVLEAGASVTEVFLDKTGTLTYGRPCLAHVDGFGLAPREVLRLAASLEAPSEHPIAKAIGRGVAPGELLDVSAFKAHAGLGVEGIVGGRRLFLGHAKFLSLNGVPVTGAQEERFREISEARRTAVFLADEKQVLGLLSSVDELRGEAEESVRLLKKEGYRVRMVTGDSGPVASRIGKEAGIDLVQSRVTPVEKAEIIGKARNAGGRVMMIGDGVNDAPALTEARVGMAMGRGTDIALESADAVLMTNDLRLIPRFLSISRKTMRVIRQNLAWAFSYNLVAIPLAVSGNLHPILSAALMAASSLMVVGNSMRLRKA
ncbi:MAG: heavy metal translocating P-type ATPase [Deltaproteobacteria bacterium]|nr:heavy metal translocating P-type ATPase [Deltaproteobacteria bacterium]